MSVLDQIDRVEDWKGVDTIIFKDGSFYPVSTPCSRCFELNVLH